MRSLPAWYPVPEDGSPCAACGTPVDVFSTVTGYVRVITVACDGCRDRAHTMVELVPA